MADSSSTSNSEAVGEARPDHPGDAPTLRQPPPPPKPVNREELHGHRYPWSLLLAFGLVALVEVGVRQIDPRFLILTRGDADQARAVRDQISLNEPVDIAFVGSSMTYQGINVPDLQSKLRNAIGREVTVRNASIRGGRVDLFATTVRHLLRQEMTPELIVVGISIRDLREYELDFERMSIFWTLGDLGRAIRTHGLNQREHLPVVLRNEIEPHWSLLKYRQALSTRIQQQFVHIDTEPMPARGEPPLQHLGSKRDVTLTMDDFKSSSNKRRMTQAYRIDLPPQPQQKFVDCVDQILADCQRAGVKLLFLDMPISEPMQGLLINADKKRKSHQIEPAYRETMSARCAAGGVPFVTSQSLGLEWRLNDFYDSQHLNYAGSTKLSTALVPWLARELAD